VPFGGLTVLPVSCSCFSQFTVIGHDMKDEINNYVRSLSTSPVRSLQDIIEFNDAHAELEFPDPLMDQEMCTIHRPRLRFRIH
jgi:hypothetical protein